MGGWGRKLWCVAVLSVVLYFGTGGQNQGIVGYGLVGYYDVGWCVRLVLQFTNGRILYSAVLCEQTNEGRAMRSHKSPPILASATI